MIYLSHEARKLITKIDESDNNTIIVDDFGIILLEILLTRYANRAVYNILWNKMRKCKITRTLSYWCKILLKSHILFKARLPFASVVPIGSNLINIYTHFSNKILIADYSLTESMAISHLSTYNPEIVERAIDVMLARNIHSACYVKAIIDNITKTCISIPPSKTYHVKPMHTHSINLNKLKEDIEAEGLNE